MRVWLGRARVERSADAGAKAWWCQVEPRGQSSAKAIGCIQTCTHFARASKAQGRGVGTTKQRLARLAAAALTAGAAAAGAVGCGGHQPRPAALRLERADLVLVAHTLGQLEASTHSEVAAARAAWPALAHGLPRNPSPATRLAAGAAAHRAGAISLPGYVTSEAGGLTGPATALGGLLEAYAVLTQRGWRFVAAALAAGNGGGKTGAGAPGVRRSGQSAGGDGGTTTAAAQFLRANAGLYIYCIYDGHYDLSLVGKALQDAYGKLGGPPAFGGSLTQRQVEALASAYSIPATRLAPHPPTGLAV
jgi:hypothetical protein